jgi:zinc transport system substrate-binding protein
MNKTIGLIAVLTVAAGGAWYLLAHNTMDKHDDEHGQDTEHHDDDVAELVAKEPVRTDGAFTITTSFYPLQFALERIVGAQAQVENIGAGRDPHDFQPSTQDILALQQADLVVLQGAMFEPWGEDVAEQLASEDVPVVIATAGLELNEGGHAHDEHHNEDEHHEEDAHHEDEEEHHNDEHAGEDEHHEDEQGHGHGAYDPHTWLDPVRFSETVALLAAAVSTLDPENATAYEANAATLQAELTALNSTYETALASCTLDETITSHDAFGYVSDRYGFTIHTIAGLSTQDVPSAQTLAELRAEAEEGIGAILLEENSVAAYGETLARETGLRTLSVNPIAYLIPEGEDYLSLMESNLAVFSDALECQ